MEEKKLFKDWFDEEAARRMGSQMVAAWPRFDERRFVRFATEGLAHQEFHGRVASFSHALRATLPQRIPQALAILTKSLPPPLPDAEAVTDGWLQWPLGHFIAEHGLPYFDDSMEAMIQLTQRFSAEFAVRPFLATEPERTLHRLLGLTSHPNVHVRRWCSEGSRPRLPWGKRLAAFVVDPSPLWPILEALKDDPERFVQKSVANHLNDIAKDHPAAVVERCRAWARGAPDGRQWVIRHALRSLVKDGHPEALALLGYRPPARIEAQLRLSPRRVLIGGSAQCLATLVSHAAAAQEVVVDYAVHYARQNGKTGRKVFKWTKFTLPGGGEVSLAKQHPMRETSVRALYPGIHKVDLQVNGHTLATASFQLLRASG